MEMLTKLFSFKGSNMGKSILFKKSYLIRNSSNKLFKNNLRVLTSKFLAKPELYKE